LSIPTPFFFGPGPSLTRQAFIETLHQPEKRSNRP
jgi:hypothetical protein